MITATKKDRKKTYCDADYLEQDTPDRPRRPSARRPPKKRASPRKPPPRPSTATQAAEGRRHYIGLQGRFFVEPEPLGPEDHQPRSSREEEAEPTVTEEGHPTVEPSTHVRDHLQQVAAGTARLDPAHVEAMVARLVDREDRAVEELAGQVEAMLHALIAIAGDQKADFGQAVDTLQKFARLHQERQQGFLRVVELLHKVSMPQRPQVQITAVAAAGVQVHGSEES